MSERHLIVDHLKFSYEGLFNVVELYNLISSFFFERGWDWYEKINQEMITPSGKQIRIVLSPWKNVSDYYKLQVNIKLNFIDVQDVEVEHEGKILKLNQGTVKVVFDGYVISDRKEMWKSPAHWFLSVVLEKYFYKSHTLKFENWVQSDIDDLLQRIKSFLNVYNYNYRS